ncbi:MAG: hypothetical protein AAGD06_07535 [Acidobacteriota bacterium]
MSEFSTYTSLDESSDRLVLPPAESLAWLKARRPAVAPGGVPGRYPAVRQGDLIPYGEDSRDVHRPEGSLLDDHYEVEIAWETSQGHYGSGTAMKLTDDEGCCWFFVDDGHDLVVKILDPWSGFTCARYWIYSKCWLDLDIQVTVRNTWDGSRRLLGSAAASKTAAGTVD